MKQWAAMNTQAQHTFSPGTRWLKIVGDRRYVIELHQDGSVTEWFESAPGDTWTGSWEAKAIDWGSLAPGLEYRIGGYTGFVVVEPFVEHPHGVEGEERVEFRKL
jgi:hypothetical protein